MAPIPPIIQWKRQKFFFLALMCASLARLDQTNRYTEYHCIRCLRDSLSEKKSSINKKLALSALSSSQTKIMLIMLGFVVVVFFRGRIFLFGDAKYGKILSRSSYDTFVDFPRCSSE